MLFPAFNTGFISRVVIPHKYIGSFATHKARDTWSRDHNPKSHTRHVFCTKHFTAIGYYNWNESSEPIIWRASLKPFVLEHTKPIQNSHPIMHNLHLLTTTSWTCRRCHFVFNSDQLRFWNHTCCGPRLISSTYSTPQTPFLYHTREVGIPRARIILCPSARWTSAACNVVDTIHMIHASSTSLFCPFISAKDTCSTVSTRTFLNQS